MRFNMEEAHDLSVDLLQFMDDEEIPTEHAIVALALTLGRLMSPVKPLSDDDAAKFIQTALEFSALFFANGRVH
jgi:hypothetical protein